MLDAKRDRSTTVIPVSHQPCAKVTVISCDPSEGLSPVAQTQLRARRPTSVHRTRPSIVGKDPRRSGRQGLAPARAASLRSEQVPNRRRGDTNGKEPARRTPCRATWTRKPRRSTSMGNSCCSIRCAPSTRSRRRLERPTRLARSPPSVGSRLVFLGHIPLTRHISPSLPDLQELDAKVRRLRDEVKDTKKTFDKTEDDLKALQSMGQIIGEVLRQLDDEKCASPPEIQAPPAPFKREPDSLRNSAPPSLFSPNPSLTCPPPPLLQSSSRRAAARVTSSASAPSSTRRSSSMAPAWRST